MKSAGTSDEIVHADLSLLSQEASSASFSMRGSDNSWAKRRNYKSIAARDQNI